MLKICPTLIAVLNISSMIILIFHNVSVLVTASILML